MTVFSLLYGKLYYLLGWKLHLDSAYMGTQVFKKKSLKLVIMKIGSNYWENLGVNF
jgi:hypothetical protein